MGNRDNLRRRAKFSNCLLCAQTVFPLKSSTDRTPLSAYKEGIRQHLGLLWPSLEPHATKPLRSIFCLKCAPDLLFLTQFEKSQEGLLKSILQLQNRVVQSFRKLDGERRELKQALIRINHRREKGMGVRPMKKSKPDWCPLRQHIKIPPEEDYVKGEEMVEEGEGVELARKAGVDFLVLSKGEVSGNDVDVEAPFGDEEDQLFAFDESVVKEEPVSEEEEEEEMDVDSFNLANFTDSDNLEEDEGPSSSATARPVRSSGRPKIKSWGIKDASSTEDDSDDSSTQEGSDSDWEQNLKDDRFCGAIRLSRTDRLLLTGIPARKSPVWGKFMEQTDAILGPFDVADDGSKSYRGVRVTETKIMEKARILDVGIVDVPSSVEFKCEECGYMVQSKEHRPSAFDIHTLSCRLKKHISEKHLGGYMCRVCEKTYPTLEGLKKHSRYNHDENETCYCEICGKPFAPRTFRTEIKRHLWSHKSEEEKTAALEAGEKEPAAKRKDPSQCMVCGKVLRSKGALRRHEQTLHSTTPKPEPEEPRFPCPRCGKMYTQQYMDVHIKQTHDKLFSRKHPCAHCDKAFSTSSQLKYHVNRYHLGLGKEFKCENCGKEFWTRYYLNRHQITHMDKTERPLFYCSLCGKGFYRKKNVARHEKTAHNKTGQDLEQSNDYNTDSD